NKTSTALNNNNNNGNHTNNSHNSNNNDGTNANERKKSISTPPIEMGSQMNSLNNTSPQLHLPRRTVTVYTETSCEFFTISLDDFLARLPVFVLESMKSWSEKLYVKGEELDEMVKEERRWKAWKAKVAATHRKI